MHRCNTSFWDGSEGRYYEEGKMYEIDIAHHTKIGTLKRFDGVSETSKPMKKRGKNESDL